MKSVRRDDAADTRGLQQRVRGRSRGGNVALAIGTDTGGSVRYPPRFADCSGSRRPSGRFRHRRSVSASATFDSIGIFWQVGRGRCAGFRHFDGTGRRISSDLPLAAGAAARHPFRWYRPAGVRGFRRSPSVPHRPGCKLVDIRLEEARERQDIFPIVLAVELLATLGRERFERHRAELDPLVEARIARGAMSPPSTISASFAGTTRSCASCRRGCGTSTPGLLPP